MLSNNELFWMVLVLALAIYIVLHVFYRNNPDLSGTDLPTERAALLTPKHRPGTGWFNEYLIERPMNLEWKINHEIDVNKPYLGSTLHQYYS